MDNGVGNMRMQKLHASRTVEHVEVTPTPHLRGLVELLVQRTGLHVLEHQAHIHARACAHENDNIRVA